MYLRDLDILLVGHKRPTSLHTWIALHSERDLHILERDLYILERTLHILSRDLRIRMIAMHSTFRKRPRS